MAIITRHKGVVSLGIVVQWRAQRVDGRPVNYGPQPHQFVVGRYLQQEQQPTQHVQWVYSPTRRIRPAITGGHRWLRPNKEALRPPHFCQLRHQRIPRGVEDPAGQVDYQPLCVLPQFRRFSTLDDSPHRYSLSTDLEISRMVQRWGLLA